MNQQRYTDIKRELDAAGVRLNLRNANFDRADIQELDLSGADLTDASLQGVNLMGVNLRGAILAGTNLSGTIIDETTDLTGARLDASVLNPKASIPGLPAAELGRRGFRVFRRSDERIQAALKNLPTETAKVIEDDPQFKYVAVAYSVLPEKDRPSNSLTYDARNGQSFPDYQPSGIYEAPLFSCERHSVTHPGLSILPRVKPLKQGIVPNLHDHPALIQVLVPLGENINNTTIIGAEQGGQINYRVPRFVFLPGGLYKWALPELVWGKYEKKPTT